MVGIVKDVCEARHVWSENRCGCGRILRRTSRNCGIFTIQAPENSGTQFHNYKGSFSIVLLAVVDARYCFRMIDVGAYGKSSDGGTLSSSAFGQALRHGTVNLPPDAPLPGAEGSMPFVFVADEAFPLWRNMMRPFPGHNLTPEQRVFNYRLS